MKPSGGTRTLLSAVTDAVVLVDSRRRVSFMNPEAENLTGFSAADAEGKDLWDVCVFIDQNTRKPLIDDLSEVLSRDGYFNFPVAAVIVHREGDERLVRGGVFLSDDSRSGSDVIEGVVFRNVSARWLIDTALQRNQKAETIRILAGGITGRLNDLLTVLLARLSGISRNHKDRAAVFRSIRDSKKIIGRISSIVSSLSPGEDTVDIGADICLVRNTIRSSLSIFIAAFPGMEVKLAYPDRTGYAGVPPGLVEQIVVNLLMNAGEATRASGTIRVTACRVDLSEDMKPVNAGSYVMISVSDDGCGISDENLTRIFDPFYSTRREKGGLGLSAVYSIVNSYHGYITVKSELEEGSTFSIYLPAADKIVTETAEDVFPRVSIAGFTDHESKNLEKILEAIGCTVFQITSESMKNDSVMVDTEVSEYNLLLTDYEFYMSEIDRLQGSVISEQGVIAVINESYRMPDNPDSNIVYIRRPFRNDIIAVAVAENVWSRPVNTRKDSENED
ncbi:MAG: PAS domain-containing protein [Candidatus Aegiribacteria sp.]|nr:PAS domain-containing protein [Candidatus Aegiribacteria sp.]